MEDGLIVSNVMSIGFFFFNKEMLVSNVQIYRSEHVHIHTKTQLNKNINGEKNININIIYADVQTDKIN